MCKLGVYLVKILYERNVRVVNENGLYFTCYFRLLYSAFTLCIHLLFGTPYLF
ncbi:hypothetical protein BCN_4403 [Bacillus cereus NC7401]|nr:hypothetical protein BCN_4403 [Bacillus cereus NC7401]